MAENLRESGNKSMRNKEQRAIIYLQGEAIFVVIRWGCIVAAQSLATEEKWNLR